MKIFIFEHVCGGGMAGGRRPPEWVEQGAAMLEAAVSTARAAGAEVAMTLDARSGALCSGVVPVVIESAAHLAHHFDRLSRSVDGVLVIAPETEGILAAWARRLDALGAISLGSDIDAIRLCADKVALATHFLRSGVPTPPVLDALPPARFPVVVKPRDGAGCQQTYVCRDGEEWRRLGGGGPAAIVQPCCHWPHGLSVGVSLLVRNHTVRPLICRRQRLEAVGDGPLQLIYRGGDAMDDSGLCTRAQRLAVQAAASVPGLHGILGVDVLLAVHPEQDVVIEINPRCTLSFAALAPADRAHMASTWLAAGRKRVPC